ncbi:hypothetical protein F4778DRAFT_776611 [Xylariomycetidae sp. FL2044]|nr:hypothetical protein F4778DRAFT_776611 [Xylariomycetidae sp. FL2044]
MDLDHNSSGRTDESDITADDDDYSGSEYDEFAPFQWLEQLDCYAHQPNDNGLSRKTASDSVIGMCDAKLIRRDSITHSFWDSMEPPSEETSDLAIELFDRYGRLNRKYLQDDYHKGTGVWGNELDTGDILLFEKLSVSREFRHQKIGTRMVQTVLDRVRMKIEAQQALLAIVGPGALTQEVRQECKSGADETTVRKTHVERAQNFWRSLGFRRIGTSRWFALTDAQGHPSQQLDVASDWEPPIQPTRNINPALTRIFTNIVDPNVGAESSIDDLNDVISSNSDSRWMATNLDGNTMLHLAALGTKPELTGYILSRAPQLRETRNQDLHTPLEALQKQIELVRSVHLGRCVSDHFKGHGWPKIVNLGALIGEPVYRLDRRSDEDNIYLASVMEAKFPPRPALRAELEALRKTLRLKYGCTCGQCSSGFLSPRMNYALVYQADITYDFSDEHMDNGGTWVMANELYLTYVRGRVRVNMTTNKSMRKGFREVCGHIRKCLQNKIVPTTRNVLEYYHEHVSEWPPVTRTYLERGGTVEAVATMLFQRARDADKWAGDDWHSGFEGQKEFEELPVCRNDGEFGFASGMCGYSRDFDRAE